MLWEAQFGDFINGAQVIVDQFLSAGLSKWGLTTRLTLLLPHGYEGQGPEHSSARLERFLQLAAEGNIRVANPHHAGAVLPPAAAPGAADPPAAAGGHDARRACSDCRRPARGWRTSPRAPGGRCSTIPRDAADAPERRRLVLCSGKIYYDLLAEAEKMGERRPAIVRVEQLYSFPWTECARCSTRYPKLEELVWVQEEPRNMGAWTYVEPKLRELAPEGVDVLVRRPARAGESGGGLPGGPCAEQSRIVREALERAIGGAGCAPHGGGGRRSQGLKYKRGRLDRPPSSSAPSRLSSLSRIGRSDACRASSLSGSERCSP